MSYEKGRGEGWEQFGNLVAEEKGDVGIREGMRGKTKLSW